MTMRRNLMLAVVAGGLTIGALAPVMEAQTVTPRETALVVRRALERLPYYGVFDFLAFSVDRGVVSVKGFAYNSTTRSEAATMVKQVAGVVDVSNGIEVLPASQDDDRIRWTTFYRIYTDDFLSRYAPGGAMSARYAALDFARFPGMQPFGNYPIHIVVKNRRTMLFGIVDNESDKQLAYTRAREVSGVAGVENELIVKGK
jgi:hyperosmotically inducible periplasmic protein